MNANDIELYMDKFITAKRDIELRQNELVFTYLGTEYRAKRGVTLKQGEMFGVNHVCTSSI